jgi:hypothetical protein
MRKRIIGILLCMLIITLQFFSTGSIVYAEDTITITTEIIGRVAEINGVYYVSPMSTYAIRYKVTNDSSQYDLKDIEIVETGPGRTHPTLITSSSQLGPGDTSSPVTGESYSGDPSGSNTVKYKVNYKVGDEGTPRETKEYSIDVRVAQADFKVNYTSNVQGTVFKGEQVELTAEVESISNLPLYNITVFDTDLGEEIGVIDIIMPGSRATVKTTIPIEKSTNGNLVIIYDDPLGFDQRLEKHVKGNLQIQVKDEDPVSSLELKGKPDKTKIPGS